MTEVWDLVQATLCRCVAADACVTGIQPLPEVAQDYSGAVVRFYEVSYTTHQGSTETRLVTKDALIYERQILDLLQNQGHPALPFSHTFDLETRAPRLVCMQEAGTRRSLSPHHIATVAQTLATIHSVNRGAPYLPWMRRLTNDTFFPWWRHVWEQACADDDFIHSFGPYIEPVERAAERFAQVLDQLWAEDCCTVLHTDLSAWHVLLHNDQPSIIDWDQARYGPLYLDLVNLFTLQTVPLYYAALVQTGFAVAYDAFLARFHGVWACGGLKYMVPALLAWVAGERVESGGDLAHLLPRAIATHAPAA